jgi:AcrR family transcriptional regulator
VNVKAMKKISQNSQVDQPKRQVRGQKRIEQLLRAAGEVFGEVGYENATTNAIAAKAGVSPGTLYQFFANKQAIAEALANDYAAKDQIAHEQAFDLQATEATLHEIIARTVDPFLAFRQNAPGFDALFMGSVVSRELATRIQSLHDGLKHRIGELISSTNPKLPKDAVQTSAEVCVQIVKGLMPLALNGTAEQRRAGARELKSVLERYLAPIVEGAPPKPGKPRKRP